MNNKKTEVLAPAGNFESLTAAVRSGADAVYFGCKDFSARRNAVNFSFEEMAQAVKYCKRNDVKTYLTLNIAIKDSEMANALNTAETAYLMGVDGLIVSDLGLASLIHKRFPDIELHASTQMSVNSPSALEALKEMGFCRVVPAREMSKKELIEFCKTAKSLQMEVEVFVHGALCMCLSGQCLLSSILGGRSGNRGLCAGPCRLPFGVQNGTGYDLSLKDLSLFDYVGELGDMGVSSLKIEGRMKRPEYIAAAVSACRSAVDSGKVADELNEVLEGVFSRSGFTDGYYTDNLGKDMFGIRNKDDVLKSKETYAYLHSLYRNERPKIPLNLSVDIVQNEAIKLEISGPKHRVSVLGGIPQIAQNTPITKENVESQLSKFGGTPFFLGKISVNLQDGLFVSNKELNELRRNATEKIAMCYEEAKQRSIKNESIEIIGKKHKQKPKIYAEFFDVSKIPDDINGIDMIIVPLEKIGEIDSVDIPVAVAIPKFTSDERKIENLLETAKTKGITMAVCDTLSAVMIAQKLGFCVIGGTGLNVFNEYSANMLEKIGVKEILLSAEMQINRVNNFKTNADKGIFAYGRLPLMAFRNCPIKNGKNCGECDKNGYITDRTNTKFPIRCRNTFCEMLNSKPIYLADRLDEIKNTDFFVLSFFAEEKGEIRSIIDNYIYGGKPIDDYTRGLYYRDVL